MLQHTWRSAHIGWIKILDVSSHDTTTFLLPCQLNKLQRCYPLGVSALLHFSKLSFYLQNAIMMKIDWNIQFCTCTTVQCRCRGEERASYSRVCCECNLMRCGSELMRVYAPFSLTLPMAVYCDCAASYCTVLYFESSLVASRFAFYTISTMMMWISCLIVVFEARSTRLCSTVRWRASADRYYSQFKEMGFWKIALHCCVSL